METRELERILKNLDQTVLGLGNSIQNMRRSISQYYMEADSLESMAYSIMSNASSMEDPTDMQDLYNQATSYMNQAESCRMQAENLQYQVESMVSELRGYRTHYQQYMEEGQTNLYNLKIAADQLTGLSGKKYGGDKIREALMATKQRAIYNQNLVSGCQKRMNWITQICGPDGDSYVKVKRR